MIYKKNGKKLPLVGKKNERSLFQFFFIQTCNDNLISLKIYVNDHILEIYVNYIRAENFVKIG